VPSYCVTHGIIFSSSNDLLTNAYGNDVNVELWAWINLKGDAACLVLHFVIGSLILIIIESDICSGCSKFTFRSLPDAAGENEKLMDNDVLAEEERV
jgi:hypothetical protein